MWTCWRQVGRGSEDSPAHSCWSFFISAKDNFKRAGVVSEDTEGYAMSSACTSRKGVRRQQDLRSDGPGSKSVVGEPDSDTGFVLYLSKVFENITVRT